MVFENTFLFSRHRGWAGVPQGSNQSLRAHHLVGIKELYIVKDDPIVVWSTHSLEFEVHRLCDINRAKRVSDIVYIWIGIDQSDPWREGVAQEVYEGLNARGLLRAHPSAGSKRLLWGE
jgi:hypothetical protein